MDEQTLIERAKQGDVEAFEILINEHQKRIYNIAFKMLGNQEDALDLSQEVLIKIFKNIHKFHGSSKFSTWVYRVATNTCLDEIKKRRKHTTYSIDERMQTEDGDLATDIPDTSPTPEATAIQKDIQKILYDGINQLGDEHKKVIILRDLNGFSYEYIAKILKCSEGTVKSRISRARKRLKKILSENMELFDSFIVK